MYTFICTELTIYYLIFMNSISTCWKLGQRRTGKIFWPRNCVKRMFQIWNPSTFLIIYAMFRRLDVAFKRHRYSKSYVNSIIEIFPPMDWVKKCFNSKFLPYFCSSKITYVHLHWTVIYFIFMSCIIVSWKPRKLKNKKNISTDEQL